MTDPFRECLERFCDDVKRHTRATTGDQRKQTMRLLAREAANLLRPSTTGAVIRGTKMSRLVSSLSLCRINTGVAEHEQKVHAVHQMDALQQLADLAVKLVRVRDRTPKRRKCQFQQATRKIKQRRIAEKRIKEQLEVDDKYFTKASRLAVCSAIPSFQRDDRVSVLFVRVLHDRANKREWYEATFDCYCPKSPSFCFVFHGATPNNSTRVPRRTIAPLRPVST